jgi:hypothetical protein
MDALIMFAFIVAVLALLSAVATSFGVDSRDGSRDPYAPTEPVRPR